MYLLVRIIDKISSVFSILAGISMLSIVALILTEIIARSVFHETIYIGSEYSAYFMVAISFLALGNTLKEKGHIRIDLFNKIIKEGKPQIFMDILAFTVGLVVFFLITIATMKLVWEAGITGLQSNTVSETYLFIPQSAIPLGSLVVFLQFFAEIVKS